MIKKEAKAAVEAEAEAVVGAVGEDTKRRLAKRSDRAVRMRRVTVEVTSLCTRSAPLALAQALVVENRKKLVM